MRGARCVPANAGRGRFLTTAAKVLGLVAATSGCVETALVGPDIPRSAGFQLEAEVGRATRACVESEASGPEALRALLDAGYIEVSSMGRPTFVKRSAGTTPVLFGTPTPTTLTVVDTGRIECRIDVTPYTLGGPVLAIAASTLAQDGYRRIEVTTGSGGRAAERFVGGGQRLALTGLIPQSIAANRPSSIYVRRLTAATDRTCRNALPAALREGC